MKLKCLNVLFCFLLLSCGWHEIKKSNKAKGDLFYGAYFDEQTLFAVGFNGLTRYSEDGGQRWKGCSTPSMTTHSNIWHQNFVEKIDNDTFISSGVNSRILISSNGGESWKPIIGEFDPLNRVNCCYISFTDSGTGWVATPKEIKQTSDNGDNWTRIELSGEIELLNTICCTGDGQGYIVDKKWDVYKTDNNGNTWEKLGTIIDETKTPVKNELNRTWQIAALRAKGTEPYLPYRQKSKTKGN